MKILLVSAIYPPDIGGPATYVRQLQAGLAGRGHRVHVLAGGVGRATGVTRIRRTRPFFWIHAATRLRGFDVILAAGLFDVVALAWKAPWVARIPGDEAWERARRLGWTRHGIDSFQSATRHPGANLLKRLRTRSLIRASRVIAPSEYLRQLALGWRIPPDRIDVVPNAAEPPPNGGPPDNRLFLTAGRLVPHKGLLGILDAVAHAPKARLEIIGEGPQSRDLQRRIFELGLSNRCSLVPPLPHDRLLRRISQARAVLINSTYEGLPHLALEAMAAGVPLIARDVGGVRQAVGDAGLLLPPTAPLAPAIRILIEDDPLHERLSSNARARAAEFSLEAMVRRTEEILQRCL